MTGRSFLIAYLSVVAVLFPLDMLWLRVVAKDFYERNLGELLLAQPRLGVAALFYLFYCAGIVFLALRPNWSDGSLAAVMLAGAVLGAVAYGTYDATNYATLRGFPASVAVVDVLWGTALTTVSAGAGFWIARRIEALF